MGWGAVAGAAISAFSASKNSSGGSPGGASKKDKEKASGFLLQGAAKKKLAGLYGMQIADKNLKAVETGYANAKTGLALSGYTASQGVKQAAVKASAGLSQGLTSAGLSGTTVSANLQAGVGYNAAQQLAGIQESVGQMLAQIEISKAGAIVEANSGKAAAMQYFQEAEAEAYKDIANIWGGSKTAKESSGGWGALAGIGAGLSAADQAGWFDGDDSSWTVGGDPPPPPDTPIGGDDL